MTASTPWDLAARGSSISSIAGDTLDSATAATRAVVFQPKLKPRTRKGVGSENGPATNVNIAISSASGAPKGVSTDQDASVFKATFVDGNGCASEAPSCSRVTASVLDTLAVEGLPCEDVGDDIATAAFQKNTFPPTTSIVAEPVPCEDTGVSSGATAGLFASAHACDSSLTQSTPACNQNGSADPAGEDLVELKLKKRKFLHTSRPRSRRQEAANPGEGDKVDPSKLTMREIIKRAEATEKKNFKKDGGKKPMKDAGLPQQEVVSEDSQRDALSLAPQVQVIDGRIVVNQQSLTVGAYATTRNETDTYTRVEETRSRLNNHTYANRTPIERWKSDDTELFYKALRQFGTDFELIQQLFPGRTRRQVKSKFKKEEKLNPHLLADTLAHRPPDQSHYIDMIDRMNLATANDCQVDISPK